MIAEIDHELLERVASRDESAFDEFHRQWGPCASPPCVGSSGGRRTWRTSCSRPSCRWQWLDAGQIQSPPALPSIVLKAAFRNVLNFHRNRKSEMGHISTDATNDDGRPVLEIPSPPRVRRRRQSSG